MARDTALRALFLVVFIYLIGFGIVIPFLPFYATRYGATPWTVGWLFASYSIAQMVAAPILGGLSDRFGRRPVLLLSLFSTLISFIILALAGQLWLLFLARIVDGLGGASITTVRAYVADVTEPKDRTRAFGMIGAAFGLGFILGPALSATLAHLGPAAPAWGAAVLTLVALVSAWLWVPETVRRTPVGEPLSLRQALAVIRHPQLGMLLLTDFLYWNAATTYQTVFPLFGHYKFGLNISQVGYLLAFLGFLGVFVQVYLVGRWVRWWGERATLIFGLWLMGGALALAALMPQLWMFTLLLAPAALGGGLAIPSLIALISYATGGEEQGRVQGVSNSVESLARTVGPVWGNGLLQWTGTASPYVVAGLVLALGGVLVMRFTTIGAASESVPSEG